MSSCSRYSGQQLAHRGRRAAMLFAGHFGHQAAEAFQNVDGRIMAPRGQAAGEPGVAVQQPADVVADRLVGVVGFHQHGVERGDAPPRAAAGTFHQLRQQGEHRGGITAGGGRLAGGQADLPLRQGIAGKRIQQQQHVFPLIAEILRHRRGGGRGLSAQQGRLVARGHHHHALGQPFRSQVALDELVDLAAALADERDDDHFGRAVAGHHPQQSRSCPRPSRQRFPSAAPCRKSAGRRWPGSRSSAAR